MLNSSDSNWDDKLNISTESVDYSDEDNQNYGYDPTPYVVLERLVELDILKKDDVIVDYGCGKGRICFFINSQVGCRIIGIDHSERLLEIARENLESYGNGADIDFVNSKAEDYVPDGANCLYFFNPFSSHVFQEVLRRIGESYGRNPREILIFFYYSTIEYRLYLPTEPRLKLVESVYFSEDEIDNDTPAKLDIFKFNP
ncbi:MAG: class I SAM-dependent methyltransferase [Methanobrevibacter sp.]|uniref:class I SAM-dependent methyltransferase n=1 Tax=Methanobrevibacter sp. TaxID=66852 RepID=UPI002E794DF5|nr:class I SAM-dependent methyltransferase [Methanobrevibacter sp.]MEE0935506.1 class I SAM-dependent methyltransferase [Methanobrevibacter sp.]